MNNLYGVPHLEQYFDHPWAILPETLQSIVHSVNGMDIGAHIAAAKSQSQARAQIETPEELISSIITKHDNGVAVMEIVGSLTKFGSSLGNPVGTILMRKAIRDLAQDSSVNTILLHIDSPGGSVAGTADLANAVFEASQVKTVFAFVRDVAASAAFWIASQAQQIFTNQTAAVGAIGVFSVLADFSEEAKSLGIKVHVVKSAQFKGIGVEGAPITKDQLAEVKRVMVDLHEEFVKSVAKGRGMSIDEINELADGSIQIGQKAVDMGLVDGIATLEDTEVLALDHRPEDRRRRRTTASDGIPEPLSQVNRNEFRVTPFADLPIVREPWNPNNDNDGDIFDEIKGPNGNNWAAMKQAHLSYAPGEDRGGDPPTINDAYKLKIARRREGRMTVFFQQLASRVAIINGARGGVDLPQDVKKSAFNHAMKYYDKLDIPQEDRPTFKGEQMDDDKSAHITPGVRCAGDQQGSTADEKETTIMADKDPKPATIAELKAAIPGADAQFLVDQLDKGAPLDQAKDAWMNTLEAQNQNLRDEKKALEDQAKPADPPPGGQAPVGGDTPDGSESSSGDAEAYEEAVQKFRTSGMSRSEAIRKARKADPQGHRAYVVAQNPGREHLVDAVLPAV